MKKRILSILLALCMCLTFVPVTVLADDLPQQDNSIRAFSISPDPDNTTYYTYEFYVNGEKVDTQIVKNGDTLLEPQVEAQAGKVFTGWDQEVPFGQISGLTGEDRTIEVHAVFADGYYVYFKDNTGRIIATKTGKPGDKITFEDVNFAVGTDEAITGWYTDKDCTSGNQVESVTIEDSNITLYAKVEEGHWITFESNGGSYVAPAFYATSATAEAPTAPTKPGYTFAGWYLDDTLYTFGSVLTGNITLTAKWTAAKETKYTVIHFWENANDDGYSFKESETKTGATGGKTNATAKSYQGFTAQTITQQEIAGDGSTIVKVYYKRNVYSVKFYSYSGLLSPSEEYTSLRITAKYGAYIGDQWPTYDGSNAWSIRDGGSTYQVNIDTMPLGGASFYGPKSGWGSETAYYYVEVLPGETGTNHNGVTYKEHHRDTSPGTGYSVTKEDKYPITGFTYKEGTKNGNSYNNAKFYYTRNSYDIVFVVNDGAKEKTVSRKFEQSIADVSYTPNAPVGKEGYVFAGWYDNELGEGNAYVFTGKTMPAQNITLYAKWVAPTYTVTVYDQNGKSLSEFTVSQGETVIGKMPDVTVGEDETFLGWVQDSPNGEPFTLTTEIHRDYSLYAKVGSTKQYTVTYDSNGGTGSVTDSEKYGKGAFATVKANTFTNGSKVFLGWNTKADGTGMMYYPNGTIKVTDHVILYAIWGDKASTVTVTYHSNFGNPEDIQTVTDLANNSSVTLKDASAFTRTGYTLTGWNTQAGGQGIPFALGASARVDSIGSNDLYAQWRINQYNYTVEYYIDGVKDKSMTETAKADFGTEINSYVNKCPTGYVLDKTESLPLTIGVTESENVIKVFYKKNVFDLTIHYVYADGGTAAADHTDSVTFGASYSVPSPTIDGYTADKTTVSGTMPARNVVETVTYSRRTDLSYTVNYYWNDKTTLLDSKKVNGQTYGAVITNESPIGVDGYTALPNQSSNLTITTGQNVINFYYYKNVKLTANSATYIYDGTEKSVSGFTGAPAGADFSAITVGAEGTDAGTYDANFAEGTVNTVDATQKYIVTVANNGALVITPVAKVTVTITENSGSEKYDGTEKTVSGYTVSIDNSLYTENDFAFSGTATATGTDAGKYDMELKASDFQNTNTNFTNVEFVIVDGQLEITKRNVTLTSATDEKVYDGTPLTNGAVIVGGDGFANGEGATYDVTGTITDVDTVNNTFTYTLNEGTKADNYNVETVEGTLTVTPVTDKVTVTIKGNTKSEIYDATEKTVTGYEVVSISNPLYKESDFTLKQGATDTVTKINAGTYPMGLDFQNISKNFTNVEFDVTDGSLEIKQRDVTITGESASKTYNGKVQQITGITVEGLVDGHSYAGLTYLAEGKDAGKYDGSFSGRLIITDANSTDVTANYNVKTVAGVLTITRSYRPSTPSTPTTPVTSVKTGDMGIALYAMTSLLSLSGAVAIIKKRKEDEK